MHFFTIYYLFETVPCWKHKALGVSMKKKTMIFFSSSCQNSCNCSCSTTAIAHWAFYFTMVHKKSRNLKNSHFLQSRTKIVLIKIKFAKFWHILRGMMCSCVLNRYIEKVGFYIVKSPWREVLTGLKKAQFV